MSLAFFFTLLIGISQLLNNRATDIDDILLNLIGAVVVFVGSCIFFNEMGLAKLFYAIVLYSERKNHSKVAFCRCFKYNKIRGNVAFGKGWRIHYDEKE